MPLRVDSSSSNGGGGGGGLLVPLISSWVLRTRRGPRYIILLICSPILLPFLCFSFPLICFAELCIRACRRRRPKANPHVNDDDLLRQRCEEDVEEAGEVRLLQRYLEDQLTLVRSLYECGDVSEGDCRFRDFDSGQRTLFHS
uniref:Uncharacterized protein n=1 Tax=Kalanchoe fedtschenkoi TaxID=63787 RepID=A0A7N0TLV7_KALFE